MKVLYYVAVAVCGSWLVCVVAGIMVCAIHDWYEARRNGMAYDSAGKTIEIGDRVRFRGKVYTIKGFKPLEGRLDTAVIQFEEPQDTAEVADEISVDKL